MKIKFLNNRKYNRAFSNGLWYKKGLMFPEEKRKYIQVGFFGLIISIFYGKHIYT